MSSQEFWFGNPQDYFVYQDAHIEKQKNRHDEEDIKAWAYARYNMYAIGAVLSGKATAFPKEPLSIAESRKPKSAEQAFAKLKGICDTINKNYKERNKA